MLRQLPQAGMEGRRAVDGTQAALLAVADLAQTSKIASALPGVVLYDNIATALREHQRQLGEAGEQLRSAHAAGLALVDEMYGRACCGASGSHARRRRRTTVTHLSGKLAEAHADASPPFVHPVRARGWPGGGAATDGAPARRRQAGHTQSSPTASHSSTRRCKVAVWGTGRVWDGG